MNFEREIEQRVAFRHEFAGGGQRLNRAHAQPDQQHGDGNDQPGQRAGGGNRQQVSPVAHRTAHGDHRAQRAQRRHRQRQEIGQAKRRTQPAADHVVPHLVRHQNRQQADRVGDAVQQVQAGGIDVRRQQRADVDHRQHGRGKQHGGHTNPLAGPGKLARHRHHHIVLAVRILAQHRGKTQRRKLFRQPVEGLGGRDRQPAAQPHRVAARHRQRIDVARRPRHRGWGRPGSRLRRSSPAARRSAIGRSGDAGLVP